MSAALILVFARPAVAGRVKTRLVPALGDGGALAVYEQLLEHTLTVVADSGHDAWLCPSELDTGLSSLAADYRMGVHVQRGEDLGERMERALKAAHDAGYQRAVLVGSDCPVMDAGYLTEALKALEHADVVLGPAEDGGYVLLGSARATPWTQRPLAGVRFGGAEALADTVAALQAWGQLAQLPLLWDVDEPPDWYRARREGLLS